MALNIPTVDFIYEGILNDYATQLNINVTDLGVNIRVEAKATAGLIYSFYLLLSQVQNNLYADISEEDQLLRDGYIELERYPTPADQGVYSVTVTGNGGSTIAESSQFTSNADSTSPNFVFILDIGVTIPGTVGVETTYEIELRALTAGTDSRLIEGDKLTSVQPLLLIDNEVVVSGVTVQPVAEEDIEAYRKDVLESRRLTAQGGSPSDYRLWCSEIGELRTVYPYLGSGAVNNIDIYAEATPENSAVGEIAGVPTLDAKEKVYRFDGNNETGAVIINPITGNGRKPATVANINVISVIPVAVRLAFFGLSNPNTAGSIQSALDDLLYEIRPFVAGADVLSNKNDIITKSLIYTAVYEAIRADGAIFNELTITIDSAALIASYQFKYGDIPYLNSISNNGDNLYQYGS